MQKVINVKLRSKLEGNFVKWRCLKRIIWEDCFHDSLIAASLSTYGSPSPGQPGSKAKSESWGNRADHILGIWNQTAEERVKILDIGPPALVLRFSFFSPVFFLCIFLLSFLGNSQLYIPTRFVYFSLYSVNFSLSFLKFSYWLYI